MALALAAAGLAPVCEELAFRGYLQTTVLVRRTPAVALATSTIAFAVLHLDPVRFPALLVLGLLFGWMAWRANSVWPAVIGHAVNNGLATAIAFGAGIGSEPVGEAATAGDLAIAASIGAIAVAGAVAIFRHTTPAPPPASGRLAPADPRLEAVGFSPRRVPLPLARTIVAGLAVALAILAVGVVLAVTGVRRPEAPAKPDPVPVRPTTPPGGPPAPAP
jgi:hypothetical protein